jgi:DNA-binding response OmpR family regulator
LAESAASVERYSLAVVTDDEEPYPEIRKRLGSEFRTSLATTESEIKDLMEQSGLHAILFNLDCIGDGPSDGLDVLEEIRKIRNDVVLVAFTKTNSRSIPLKASQAFRSLMELNVPWRSVL